MAHAACSREEPEPKFLPPTNIFPLYVGSFNTKSALGVLSGWYRQSRKRLSPKPSRAVAFKKRAGMIWSVSTFSIGSGTAGDSRVTNLSMGIVFVFKCRWASSPLLFRGAVGAARQIGRAHV